MNFLTGLQNFLNIINDNWTTILVCAGLIVGIVKKTQDYLSKSDDEKLKLLKLRLNRLFLKRFLMQKLIMKNGIKLEVLSVLR